MEKKNKPKKSQINLTGYDDWSHLFFDSESSSYVKNSSPSKQDTKSLIRGQNQHVNINNILSMDTISFKTHYMNF